MPDTTTTDSKLYGWTTRHDGVLVIVPNYWGWGVNIEEAKAAAKKAAPSGTSVAKGKRAVYVLPTGAVDAVVDEYGRIAWDWADDAPDRTAVGTWLETI